MRRHEAFHHPATAKRFGTPCWFTRPDGFTPASIAGLVLWLSADATATLFQTSSLDTPALSDGDPVGGWKNRATDTYHALQAASSPRPLLRLGALNGLPVIEFDGTDDVLAVTRMEGQLSSGLSYFLLLQFSDGRPVGTRRPFGARTGLPVQGYLTSILTSGGDLSHATWIDSEIYEIPWLNLPDGETPWHLLSLVAEPGAALTSYVDGVQSATIDISAATWSNIAGVLPESPFLGADNLNGFPSGPHSLRLAELLIYGVPLDASDREAIEQYLATKYALT